MVPRTPARKPKPSSKYASCDSVRESFLAAGRRLFAEKGFDGVSVKELATATGHNGALVNYYFTNKEGLYRECVLPLAGVGLATMERTLRTPTSRQDFLTRFELFVEEFVAIHLQHEDLCIILKRDMNTPVIKKLYKEHFSILGQRLQTFLKGAKRAKFLRPDVDTEIAAHIVISCIFQLITSERFRSDVGECCFLACDQRLATVRQLTRCLLYGISITEA